MWCPQREPVPGDKAVLNNSVCVPGALVEGSH